MRFMSYFKRVVIIVHFVGSTWYSLESGGSIVAGYEKKYSY